MGGNAYVDIEEAPKTLKSAELNPITVVKVGDPDFRPSAEDLEAWRNTFEAARNDPNFKIFTHSAVAAPTTLSREDAIVQISTLTTLAPEDVEGFLACNDEEKKLLVKTYSDAGQVTSADTWAEVLKVLQACSQLAVAVLPVLNAVSTIFSTIQTIISL
jgi:hypothetical protein